MAEKEPQKKEEQDSAPQKSPFSDRHRNLLTVAVVGGLMLVEGAGILIAVKFLGGGPEPARAGLGIDGDDSQGLLGDETELKVTDMVSFNSTDGRVFVYQISVYASVETEHSEKIETLLELRKNTIDDRLSKVIRAANPKYLDEPGLETMQRQFKHELDQILGDDTLIKAILFPEFSKTRAD